MFRIAAAMLIRATAAVWCVTAWGATFVGDAGDVSTDTAVALMAGYFGGVVGDRARAGADRPVAARNRPRQPVSDGHVGDDRARARAGGAGERTGGDDHVVRGAGRPPHRWDAGGRDVAQSGPRRRTRRPGGQRGGARARPESADPRLRHTWPMMLLTGAHYIDAE